ncbi:transposase-like protein [Saccharopolyspora lacisalsi]|uniref:Transposase-like protein n=1 Tax=Halosaccharopolyspora lacisalsi TaxID=1000566 RepID=A0A839DPQ4_9PSEU|nr:helix-turn-helix domain-containing protein [Halosaccharopolyspora lacisalsi]MBA8822719.1 transposase-like protein [Halosaccharopolyspora lacisalsi]
MRSEREERRSVAADLFEQGGRGQAEIARLSEVTPQAISAWHHRWLAGCREALHSPGTPGAQCRWYGQGRVGHDRG